MSHVTCHMSLVTCHLSHVTCHISSVTKSKSHSHIPFPCLLLNYRQYPVIVMDKSAFSKVRKQKGIGAKKGYFFVLIIKVAYFLTNFCIQMYFVAKISSIEKFSLLGWLWPQDLRIQPIRLCAPISEHLLV